VKEHNLAASEQQIVIELMRSYLKKTDKFSGAMKNLMQEHK
jgi:hypothetical protein